MYNFVKVKKCNNKQNGCKYICFIFVSTSGDFKSVRLKCLAPPKKFRGAFFNIHVLCVTIGDQKKNRVLKDLMTSD